MHPGRSFRRDEWGDVHANAHGEIQCMGRRHRSKNLKGPKYRGGDGTATHVRAPDAPSAGASPPSAVKGTGQARRLAATTRGWCSGPIAVKARGRIPKWCSAACRQRAWELSRAAASGRSAVQVVELQVEVPVPGAPKRADWPRLLDELARQLDDGRISTETSTAWLQLSTPSLTRAFDVQLRGVNAVEHPAGVTDDQEG
jgi:hypothetical protein